jgi:hypothetical protein
MVLLLAMGLGGALIYAGHGNNAGPAAMPAPSELAASRNRAIEWLRNNEAEVLATNNPALWWMVRESAARSGSAYLADLYRRLHERYLAGKPHNPWQHMFDAGAGQRIPVEALDAWPDYNLLFLYGLSCQSALRAEPRVAALLKPDACGGIGTPAYFRDPACITHQLMGVRFMQDRRCEDARDTAALATSLVERIVVDMEWDFRVVDFYIQRLMMLAESGAGDRIRARWLVRVLDAQRPDGGWDDLDPLIEIGERTVGWSGRSLRLRKAQSNFHTTAQGLYLMTLLTQTGRTGER